MRDINDLRDRLVAETAHLTVDISPDVIRRRARGVRMRRAAATAVAAALTVAALVVPGALLLGGSTPASDVGGGDVPSSCPRPNEDATLGPLVETGTTLDAPNLGTQFDVLIGFVGTRDQPGFVLAFHDQHTGEVRMWDITGLARDSLGDLPGKHPEDPTFQFLSKQLTLGPNSVLDVGLYTRSANRITVASEGRETDAQTRVNAETGWTLFWAQRTAAPLPLEHNVTAEEYQGPERLTLTAYDAAGRPQHAVTGGPFVGHYVQNPRDHSPIVPPSSSASATPPAPMSSLAGNC